jgi:ubiquinone/menaquinone biosynthesis C-methylase UbiE
MSGIDVYSKLTDEYEKLQLKRPDYSGAVDSFLFFATKYLKDKGEINVIDFCCGTGSMSLLLSQQLNVDELVLVDINKDFLDIALMSDITARQIKVINGDITKIMVEPRYDLVISMFAYHHVTDSLKNKYIEIAKNSLKPGGIVILGEIYSTDKATIMSYYKKLLDSIPEKERTDSLKDFLMQTASSEDFEYKVSREFACNQLISNGFKELEVKKIWPLDDDFEKDIGTFVEVWQRRE